MSESEDRTELGGLARTIDALFVDRSAEPSTDSGSDEVLEDADFGLTVDAAEASHGAAGLDDLRSGGESVLDIAAVVDEAVDTTVDEVTEDVPPVLADFDGVTPSDQTLSDPDRPGEPPSDGSSESLTSLLGGMEEEQQELQVPPLPGLDDPESPKANLDIGAVASSEVVWSESPELLDASTEALGEEVEAFLNGPEGERMEHAAQIAEIGESMKGSSTFDPMVAAVEKLALAAGDPPAQDIIAVAETLLLPAVSSRIVALLGVEKDETRQAELRTVCIRIGHPMAVALSDALAETKDRFVRHACVGTIVEMGQAAMPVVEAMIEDKRWFVVRNAVTVLGDSGGPRAIELIMSTLANSDGRVRREALQALAKLGGEDAGQLVYGMLEDPDSEVRVAAAVACGELKVERALKLLVKMLEDEKKNPDFIVAVLRALGQLGDPGAVNAIEKHATPSLFSRPRTDVRIAAYRALNHIGTPYARRLLNRAADDKDQEIKRIVRDILGMG